MADQSVSDLLLINSDMAAGALTDRVLVEALRSGHRSGTDDVDRMLLTEPSAGGGAANHLLIWGAWQHGDVLGAKIVTVFPGNKDAGWGETVSTVYALFDGRDGRPLALFHGSELTLRKTAADSALAADILARSDVETLLVVGAGAQSFYQARAIAAVRPTLRRAMVWNRSPAPAREVAARMSADILPTVAVEVLEDAVRSAEVVTCATAATVPLVHGEWLAPGTHLDLVGSFTADMREADDEAARRSTVFVDTRRFAGQTGDIAGPVASGALRPDGIAADLFELCRGRHAGRTSGEEITFFKNAGGGHLDLMAAAAIYRALRGPQ
jgi:ornithine cyclodeaminase